MSVLPQGAWLRELRSEIQRRMGTKVRELREERGWTQAQLGERIAEVVAELEPHRPDIYLTQAIAISRLERGVLTVNLELVEILARALAVDPLILIEPAFTRTPRDAEVIEEQRRDEFGRRLDQLYESRLARPPGRDFLERAMEVVLTWPEAEVEVFVGMLNRLSAARQIERLMDQPGFEDEINRLDLSKAPTLAQVLREWLIGRRRAAEIMNALRP